MNILITGANGFIGKALTKKFLSEGFEVYALVTSQKDMEDIKSQHLHTFVMLFEKYNDIAKTIITNIDIAFHLAWHGLSGSDAKNVELQLRNVMATSVLLEQLKILGVRKFVLASTMNTLEVRREISNPLSVSPRGTHIHVACKINAEIVARTFCFEHGIEFNEGIIAMAYGEGNHSKMITNIFIYSILNHITPNLVSGENCYDIIYIDDIVDALFCVGLKGHDRKSYYIGHNWNKTFKDIFVEIKNIVNPDAALSFGAYPDDNAIDFSIIDRNELTNDTGWVPKYDFKESIINTANWIKMSGFKI